MNTYQRKAAHRWTALITGAALVSLVTLFSALPAQAHEDLSNSFPAENDVLNTAPETVSLEFTEEIMEMGTLVLVEDSQGSNRAAAESTTQGRLVTTGIEQPLEEGAYQVRWRAVSADSHPISGVIPFTVGEATPTTTPTAETAPHSETPVPTTATQSTTAHSTTPEQPTSEELASFRWGLVAAIGASIVAIAGFIVFLALRIRRNRRLADAARADESHSTRP